MNAASLRRRVPWVLTLLLAAPGAFGSAERFPDLHSGERALRLLLETENLGPLRKRAAEIGSAEIRLERERTARLKAAGRSTTATNPSWVSIGPTYRTIAGGTPDNAGDNSGLAAGIAIHPTDPKTLWLASAGGGIWKTSNGGTTWRPVTDLLGPTPTGAIAVSPSNPSRVYAGTGCGDSSSSYQSASGFGVLISNDGGETWRVGAAGTGPGNTFFELSVDPANPDVVLAASDAGVQRSTDGGDTWKQVIAVPAYSLSRASADPKVLFAGTWNPPASGSLVSRVPGSIWKSTDGGATFVEKAAGLPGDPTSRARPEVAVAPSDPSRVYALFSDTSNLQIDMVASTDGGDSWMPLNLKTKKVDILSTQGNYFSDMAVDPSNPNVVYAGGLDLWKTTDGGGTWTRISRWQGIGFGSPYVHADQHAIVFASDGSILFSTDGGLYRTTNGGQSFMSLNRGLVTMQFYNICTTPVTPDLVMGGAQDNGTSFRVQGTEYRAVIDGDGFSCLAHPTNPQILHGTVYLEYVVRSTDGGATWNDAYSGITDAGDETNGWFPTILRRHPVNADWIYTSSLLKVWESKNGGTSWKTPSGAIPVAGLVAIRDFSFLPTDGSRLAVAANAGIVMESTDGAVTFQKIGTLPVNTLMAVRYDRTDSKTLYVASALVTPGVERVWVTHDSGQTWQPLSKTGKSGGLPDLPVMTLEQDPRDPNVLWAGSYVGLYRSGDRGQSWSRFGDGLPNVMAMSIEITPDGSKLRLGTFGRGIWEIETGATSINNPPVVQVLYPSATTTVEAGTPVSFRASGSDPDPGDTITYSWSFGDGSAPGAGIAVDHWYGVPGTYTVILTGTDSHGATATATRTVIVTASTISGASLLLPVVLEAPGNGGSYYTSEVTIASRLQQPVDVLLTYTASTGGGSGFARFSMAPGAQLILPGILGWLRGRGLPIPEGSSARVGTLLVTFSGTSSTDGLFAGARTFTPDPLGGAGTFGLFYLAAASSTSSATVFGLQQSSSQRSNLALVNAGSTQVTLRTQLFGPAGQDLGTVDTPLEAYGWAQRNTPLAGTGVTSGRAVVTRISGSSSFTAYGVLNDAVTSDGSFIPPLLPGDASAAERLVPIVLSASGYTTELTLANLTASPLTLTLVYTASPQLNATGSGSAPVTLGAFEQRIETDAMGFLRRLEIPVPASGNVGGSLMIRAAGGNASSFAAGARTFIGAAGGGTFGLFYTGLSLAESAASVAYVQGLQQNSAQRSNLAVVNRGDAGDAISLRITYFGPDGAPAGSVDAKTLASGEWAQFNQPLGTRGVAAGSAKIEKISGASHFVAYGVLNDQTNSDGSYIPMSW